MVGTINYVSTEYLFLTGTGLVTLRSVRKYVCHKDYVSNLVISNQIADQFTFASVLENLFIWTYLCRLSCTYATKYVGSLEIVDDKNMTLALNFL